MTITGQAFAATGTAFTDLANTAAKDKITSLQQSGLVKGVSSDRFNPDATLTAAEGTQLIVNALHLNLDLINFVKEPHATDYFKSADNNAWYAQALIIAAVNDIGLPNDLDPNKIWTKEEFTHQLILAIEKHSNLPMIKIKPMEFADQADLSIAYDGNIQRALVLGIATLDKDEKFNPQKKITRAEAAELIYNAVEYIKAHPGEGQPKES